MLSPVDLIPEAVFGVLGLIDDFVFFLFFCVVTAGCYRAMLVRRATHAA